MTTQQLIREAVELPEADRLQLTDALLRTVRAVGAGLAAAPRLAPSREPAAKGGAAGAAAGAAVDAAVAWLKNHGTGGAWLAAVAAAAAAARRAFSWFRPCTGRAAE